MFHTISIWQLHVNHYPFLTLPVVCSVHVQFTALVSLHVFGQCATSEEVNICYIWGTMYNWYYVSVPMFLVSDSSWAEDDELLLEIILSSIIPYYLCQFVKTSRHIGIKSMCIAIHGSVYADKVAQPPMKFILPQQLRRWWLHCTVEHNYWDSQILMKDCV